VGQDFFSEIFAPIFPTGSTRLEKKFFLRPLFFPALDLEGCAIIAAEFNGLTYFASDPPSTLPKPKGGQAMKAIFLPLSLLVVALVSNAQTPAKLVGAPEVEVVKFSWSKERVNWEQNPFGGPNENFHEMQFRARAEKRASDARRANSPDASKLEKDARTDAAIIQAERQKKGPPRYTFLYKTSIKNTSEKTIKEIDWDYAFLDAATGEELGRRQFTSVQTIGPGKSKELSVMLSAPPTQRISVYSLDKRESIGFVEQVVIVGVRYSNGTIWQVP